MTSVELQPDEAAMLSGASGDGVAEAMRIVVEAAESAGARRLLEVGRAHLTSCAGSDPALAGLLERLLDSGSRVMVPTTLDLGGADLVRPQHTPDASPAAIALMEGHITLGAKATFTDTPFQMDSRPRAGTRVAWARSTAALVAGGVLGARTDALTQRVALAAAVTGRVPAAGLYDDAGRRGTVTVDCSRLAPADVTDVLGGGLLGVAVATALGRRRGDEPAAGLDVATSTGSVVPVLHGLPVEPTEDAWAAFASALDRAGIPLFHAVGTTPGVLTADDALGGAPARDSVAITPEEVAGARAELTTADAGYVDAVVIGPPQVSVGRLKAIAEVVTVDAVAPGVLTIVCVSRAVQRLARVAGLDAALEEAGVRLLTDTSPLQAAVLGTYAHTVVTDSVALAAQAGALGVDVVLGGTLDCLRAAAAGRFARP